MQNNKLLLKSSIAQISEKNVKEASHSNAEKMTVLCNQGAENRLPETTAKSAFITLKNRLQEVSTLVKCQLINPSKPECDKVSKYQRSCYCAQMNGLQTT